MMQFRVVKAAVKDVLNTDAAGRYQVVGFQRQGSGSEERKLPTVTVFYREGDFDKANGSIAGPNQHDVELSVQLMVVTSSKGDLSGLQSATTPAELAAALASFSDASETADEALDELADNIYQVLMDPSNEFFGLARGAVSSRWVGNIRKDQPMPRGQSVILTGSVRLTCRVEEQLLSATGTPGTEFDTVVDIDGDDTEKTGAAGTLGGT